MRHFHLADQGCKYDLESPKEVINTLWSTLQSNYLSWLRQHLKGGEESGGTRSKGPSFEKKKVFLSTKSVALGSIGMVVRDHRRNWEGLRAENEQGDLIGSWTMIDDEGLEIRLQSGKIITFIFKYERKKHLAACSEVLTNPDLDELLCYDTDSRRSLIGWYDERGNESRALTSSGCVYASQVHSPAPTESDHSSMPSRLYGSSVSSEFDKSSSPFKMKRKLPSPILSARSRVRKVEFARRQSALGSTSTVGEVNASGLWERVKLPLGETNYSLLAIDPELDEDWKLTYKEAGGSALDIQGDGRVCKARSQRNTDRIEEVPDSYSWGDPWISPELWSQYDQDVPNQVKSST